VAVSFIRLRIALLANATRVRTRSDAVRLWGFVLVVLLAGGLTALSLLLRDQPDFALADFDSLVSTFTIIIAIVLSLFTPAQVLSASQFVQFPISPARVSLWLPLSSLLSWSSFVLILWVGFTMWLRSTDPLAGTIATIGALLFIFTVKLAALVAAEAAAQLFSTPRSQIVRSFLGWLLLVSVVPLLAFLFTTNGLESYRNTITEIGSATEWSPLGAALSAADSFTSDGLTAALLKLAVGALTLAGLSVLWVFQVRYAFTHIGRPGRTPLSKSGLGWFERFPATRIGVIGARSLTYWIRDPRYRLSFVVVPVVVVVSMLAMWIAGAPWTITWVMPLAVVAFFLGWSIHNDVATDSSAIWMHVASNTPGDADRLGRIAPILGAGIPLIILGSTLSITLMADWRPLPAVIGISSALLFSGLAVSSYASAAWPYPTSRPGESLFVQPQFAGFGAGKSQTVTVLLTLLLAAPAVTFGFIGIGLENLPLQLISLALGVGVGALTIAAGVKFGAQAFDRNGPEYIALSQVFD
jgi:ABC-2 type transport system permease protein